MATSNIPGVNADAIGYVQKALLPDKSKAEAAAFFARMIEDSLRSWFTQFNFFLHNLAQLRFHGDHNDDDQLLSFVPKTFTLATDGRIVEVIDRPQCRLLLVVDFANHFLFPRLGWSVSRSATILKSTTSSS